MKKLNSHALVLLLAAGAFVMAPVQRSIAAEKPSTAAQKAEVGSLVLKCSPVFPDFFGLDVNIDGKVVGGFTKGHVFKTSIPAGTHQITVSERGRKIDEFQGKLDVQPGRGYSYVVSYGVKQVVLEPLGSSPPIASR